MSYSQDNHNNLHNTKLKQIPIYKYRNIETLNPHMTGQQLRLTPFTHFNDRCSANAHRSIGHTCAFQTTTSRLINLLHNLSCQTCRVIL